MEKIAALLTILIAIVIALIPTWVTLSVVTSGVKSVSGKCGTEWPIEVVIGGNWFCEDKK